uniref:Uncharacterized protein n=1 Tax=Tetradesmus obliquus TaxID=3088 RepID=A0A383VEM3_TETOB|eukprot:jgi/Sobl393_1/16200/SZX64008.1
MSRQQQQQQQQQSLLLPASPATAAAAAGMPALSQPVARPGTAGALPSVGVAADVAGMPQATHSSVGSAMTHSEEMLLPHAAVFVYAWPFVPDAFAVCDALDELEWK